MSLFYRLDGQVDSSESSHLASNPSGVATGQTAAAAAELPGGSRPYSGVATFAAAAGGGGSGKIEPLSASPHRSPRG